MEFSRFDLSNVKTTAGEMRVANLSIGSNIKLVQWAPQNDVLGHFAVQAFVTHAGINSLYEAAYHATPIVAVPLVADQPENAVKVHLQAPHQQALPTAPWLLPVA